MKIVIKPPTEAEIFREPDEALVPLLEMHNIPNSSCTSVRLDDGMDYVPYEQRKQLFDVAFTKLRYGGEMVVTGTDLYAISHSLISKSISIEEAQGDMYTHRMSSSTMDAIVNHVHDKDDAEIVSYKLNGLAYHVVLRRKDV